MTINFLNIAQVLVAIALIIFILIQRGPGATAGSAFGSGASGTVFGAKGSGSFLTKATAILATLFFIITMLIAIDARDTFAASNDAGEQDLGVFGTLDSDSQEPGMVSEGDGSTSADVSDVIDSVEKSGEEVKKAATDTANDVVDAVTDEAGDAVNAVENAADQVVEEVKEAATTESDDSDNGDQ